jgi:hypothetical protein
MNTAPRWVSTTLQADKIHGQSITVKDKVGREIKGHLEVAMVNDKGQSAVCVCFNLNPDSRRVAFAAFYLTQEQMDVFTKEGEKCILGAPVNLSRWVNK